MMALTLVVGGCLGDIGTEGPASSGDLARAGEASSRPGSGAGTAGASTSTTGGALDGKGGVGACGPAGAAPARVWRLTARQFDKTVQALVGEDLGLGAGFVKESASGGFGNDAATMTVTNLLFEQISDAAKKVAAKVGDLMVSQAPCAPSVSEPDCARGFLARFARRAFRRPIPVQEQQKLTAIYEQGRAGAGFRGGIELAVQAIVQAPSFLYRTELGGPATAKAGVVKLTDHEIAAQLSYMITDGPPDEELSAAADAGRLGTPAAVEVQARRLIRLPEVNETMRAFVAGWMGLDELDAVSKDETLFPGWSRELLAQMRSDADTFIGHALGKGGGTLQSLFSAGPGLDPTKHAGLLTLPVLLTRLAGPVESSPIMRGAFVREKVLCQPLPDPPEIEINPPPLDPTKSVRERYTAHSQDPACAGCHRLIDPIGFGFENFDAVGTFRTIDEGGRPIDASGALVQTPSGGAQEGTFVGVPELTKRLLSGPDVERCLSEQMFQFAYGRGNGTNDACVVEQARTKASGEGGRLTALLRALTGGEAFLHRAVADGGSMQ